MWIKYFTGANVDAASEAGLQACGSVGRLQAQHSLAQVPGGSVLGRGGVGTGEVIAVSGRGNSSSLEPYPKRSSTRSARRQNVDQL